MNSNIQNFYDRLDYLYTQGRQHEIEGYLKKQKESFPCLSCQYDPLVVAIYSELGSFNRGQGRLKEAIHWFEAAMQMIRAHLGENTMEYATTVNNLAGAQRMDGQNAKAAVNFEETLLIYKKVVGEDNYYYISCVNNLALLEINQQNYDRAEELLNKALILLEGKNALLQEKAITLCNLGTCALCQKDNDRAETWISQAEQIYRGFPIGQQMHLAAVCNSIGGICYHRGDKEGAAKAYTEAKDLTEFYFGRNAEYAIACENLARCLEGKESGEK